MFFNGIRLPDEIRIALEEDQLAVFVGAGVSCAPPSNLPSFNRLASQIAGGSEVTAGREDRFLGKLAHDAQTDVHAAAAKILFGEHTQPTPLHREILRLFQRSAKVRVVTTNFDDHFSVAGRKLFRKDRMPEFFAPALPLGDDFTGLVYLHGLARRDPRKLVLTDKDFGTAYLTRGWARDFLVPLFSKYTVLFVGYSHSDVTMTYLARGLNPSVNGRRWAIVASSINQEAREHWEHLEVSVVEYPIEPDNADNPHQALTDFFTQWSNHVKESVFSKAKRVKAMARGLPPESDADSEYLRYCLSHRRLAKDFCDAIRHPAWVGWLHDHGYFSSLFEDAGPAPQLDDAQLVVASWLCSHVRRKYPDILLDMIRTHHQCMSRVFNRMLAHTLWVDQSNQPDALFATWVSVLLSQGKDAADEGIWAYLLDECRLPEHLGVALRLFELLTSPEIHIERGWEWSSLTADSDDANKSTNKKVDYAIKWPRAQHWLPKRWTEVFKPHLPDIAESLMQVIVRQFTHAYFLLHGVGKTDRHYDRLSSSRRSIAAHEQDDTPLDECFSCLVDILRDILVHWIQTDPPRARIQVEAWWSMNLLLFKRFAAFARSIDPQYGADERIQWLLNNDLVFRSGMKKEVFDILASAYPSALPHMRRRLLRRIGRGYCGPGAKNLNQDTLAYEKFNVLIWLRRFDSQCLLIQNAIAAIEKVHPNFVEREHPEFDSWHGKAGFVDPTEGFDLNRILLEPPEQFVDDLLQSAPSIARYDHWNFLQCLPTLFKQNKEWGRGFVEALSQKSPTTEATWNGVFWGWRDAIETHDDWVWILNIIEKLPHESAIYVGIANLIAHGFEKHQAEWNEATIDRAAAVMDRAWDLCKNEKEMPDDTYRDWLITAINHVGGWIGEFWVHYCSRLRQRTGKDWKRIPLSLQSKIVDALKGTNRVKVHARIAMTPWIGYFFAWDREFASKHLLPLLDWQHDPIIAQQSWSVFLNYKRSTPKELEDHLIPHYLQFAEQTRRMLKDATEKSSQFDNESLRNLGFCLAVLAMHIIPDPVESGFFRDFLPLLTDEVRGSLAIGMGAQLEQLDDTKRQNLWHTWLERYLDLRLIGVPVALSTEETKYMLQWCLNLGPVFAESVDLITKMPQGSVFAYGIIENILKNTAASESPLHTCRLVNAALEAENHPYLHTSLLTLHETFKSKISRASEFRKFEELLYLRGWRKK